MGYLDKILGYYYSQEGGVEGDREERGMMGDVINDEVEEEEL